MGKELIIVPTVLILRLNDDDIFFKELPKIKKYYACTQKNIIFRASRKLNLPIFSLFFGKWKKNICSFDKIILFDNGYHKKISQYIRKKNKNAKIILWYWNPLLANNQDIIKDNNIDEIWTYNRFDANKLNLKYNTQFYHKITNMVNTDIISDDIIFVGRDKNRNNEIVKIKKKLESKDIKCNFKIIKNEKDYVLYDEYIKLLLKARCILDYNITTLNGLTLRPLEALFYQKKLITNNRDIINYDFYRPNNIFVLGMDDISKIKEFIYSPYEEIDKEIVNYYDFESWLKRFEEKKNEY